MARFSHQAWGEARRPDTARAWRAVSGADTASESDGRSGADPLAVGAHAQARVARAKAGGSHASWFALSASVPRPAARAGGYGGCRRRSGGR